MILVVDDDASLLSLLNLAFKHRGFVVRLASSGEDAVAQFRKEPRAIDLVLLDVCMPGLDGPQTLQELQRIDPGVAVCFMSGYTAQYTPQDLLQRGALEFISKPFPMDQTIQALWQLAMVRSGQR